MKNPFKRLKQSEARIANLEGKIEQLTGMIIALAKIQNVHPKLLQEYSVDKNTLIKYMLEMYAEEIK